MPVNIQSLSDLAPGVAAVLQAFVVGELPAARLMAMGLRPGDTVTVLARTAGDEPVVVCRGSMRIVVDARLKSLLSVSVSS